jgi:hypothetical protein
MVGVCRVFTAGAPNKIPVAGVALTTLEGGQGRNGRYPQKLHVFLLGSITLEPIKIVSQGPSF